MKGRKTVILQQIHNITKTIQDEENSFDVYGFADDPGAESSGKAHRAGRQACHAESKARREVSADAGTGVGRDCGYCRA